MADDSIIVVSSRTIVRKVTISTPIPTTTEIRVKTNLGDLLDVDGDKIKDGHVLVYNGTTETWDPQYLLNKQIIDGEDGF